MGIKISRSYFNSLSGKAAVEFAEIVAAGDSSVADKQMTLTYSANGSSSSASAMIGSGADGMLYAAFDAAVMPESAYVEISGHVDSQSVEFSSACVVAGAAEIVDGAVSYAYDSASSSCALGVDGYAGGLMLSAMDSVGVAPEPGDSAVVSAVISRRLCENYVVEGIKDGDDSWIYYLLTGEECGRRIVVPTSGIAPELAGSGCYLRTENGFSYGAYDSSNDPVEGKVYCKCVESGKVAYSSGVSASEYTDLAGSMFTGDKVLASGALDGSAVDFSDGAGEILSVEVTSDVLDAMTSRVRFAVHDNGFAAAVSAAGFLSGTAGGSDTVRFPAAGIASAIGETADDDKRFLDGNYSFGLAAFDAAGAMTLVKNVVEKEMVYYPDGFGAVKSDSIAKYTNQTDGMVSARFGEIAADSSYSRCFSPAVCAVAAISVRDNDIPVAYDDSAVVDPDPDEVGDDFSYASGIKYFSAENGVIRIPFGGSMLGDEQYDRVVISKMDAKNGESLAGTYLKKDKKSTGWDRVYVKKDGDYFIQARNNSNSPSDARYYWCVYEGSPDVGTPTMKAYSDKYNVENNPADALKQYWTGDQISISHGGESPEDAEITYEIAKSSQGENRTVKLRVFDKYRNYTDIVRVLMTIEQTGPAGISFVLTGPDGTLGYAGYRKTDRGMVPCEYIVAKITAESRLPMTWAIKESESHYLVSPPSGVEIDTNVETSYALKVRTNENGFFDSNNLSSIMLQLEVTDSAGNTGSAVARIAFMRQLNRTAHQQLLEEGSSYSHQLFRIAGTDAIPIPGATTIDGSYVRAWNEIWWPARHAPALNADGTVDENAAFAAAINHDGTAAGDYFKLNDDQTGLAVDEEGRFIQEFWNEDIQYDSMVNNAANGMPVVYWVIDNTGWPDIQLEFEYFDFDGGVATLPANVGAPASGDMLVVYDASDPEALQPDGMTIKNSSKLAQLFILKGSYRSTEDKKFVMTGSSVVGNLTEKGNGFITPIIDGVTRLCLIPYTDNGGNASGFKLKAGPRHSISYRNYDVDNGTGEFWVHVAPINSSEPWTSPMNIAAVYQYYATWANINPEKGEIVFEAPVPYPLLGTFTAMPALEIGEVETPPDVRPESYFSPHGKILEFAFSHDDFVDYLTPTVVVMTNGTEQNASTIYNPAQNSYSGKISTGYSLQKDTGVLVFNNEESVPFGRMLASYYHHTFYRLTSDGYGDLYFYGNATLVPSPSYTNWAYVDVKVVNEGTNTLNSGTLQFLARGYVSGQDVVDAVLDENRPWDIQEGSVGETVNRTGAKFNRNYESLKTGNDSKASLANAIKARSSQACTFGTLAPKDKVFIRIFWSIATNAEGTQFINVTRGRKLSSAEFSGVYFLF